MPSKRGLLTTVAYQLKGQPPVCENTMTHTSIRVLRNGMVLCTVRVGQATFLCLIALPSLIYSWRLCIVTLYVLDELGVRARRCCDGVRRAHSVATRPGNVTTTSATVKGLWCSLERDK